MNDIVRIASRIARATATATSHRTARAALACIAVANVVGCSSAPPLNHYTLTSGPVVATAARPDALDFALAPITVPAALDQGALVVRLDSGQLSVLDNEHWAAPLTDELRDAFSTALTSRLGGRDVTAVARDPARPVVKITIDVQRFELSRSRSTAMTAVWSATAGAPLAVGVVTCSIASTNVAADAGYSALVGAQQRAIDDLAGQVAGVVSRWNAQAVPGCR